MRAGGEEGGDDALSAGEREERGGVVCGVPPHSSFRRRKRRRTERKNGNWRSQRDDEGSCSGARQTTTGDARGGEDGSLANHLGRLTAEFPHKLLGNFTDK